MEDVQARRVQPDDIPVALEANTIPVLVDPDANILLSPLAFVVVVDGRLTKLPPEPLPRRIPLHIGLGPGFHAGVNCDAAVETRRSHTLGRVYWEGSTQADSGQPEGDPRRVLRAPARGVFVGHKKIGEHCEIGEPIAEVHSEPDHQIWTISSPIRGVLRGLIRDGIHVSRGLKVGDVDARDDASACFLVSDKALAIGGGVLEAILTREEIRERLWA